MMLFRPYGGPDSRGEVRLFDSITRRELAEEGYFEALCAPHNRRNPHTAIGTARFEIAEGENGDDD